MKDIKSTIIKIKKIAKLNNKISCVFLGNTVQKEKATFYITPIRENKKFVFCSVILFNDFVANKVAKMMDGHINYILVDTEKKIQTKNTNLGLVNIERPIKETIKKSKLRVYKANDWQIMLRIRLRNALPNIFTGLRIGTTLAVIGVTVAEFVGSQDGLGHLMVLYQAYMKIPEMFAAIVVLSIFGYIFYELLKFIEKILLPWYREE